MTNLALYGLPRTFTNLLGWLVEANFRDVRCHHGVGVDWKHTTRLHEIDGMDGYLLCAKDPFAWCASMLRYKPKPLSELVARWNEWGRNALAFAPRGSTHATLVKYEWVLECPSLELFELGRDFGLIDHIATPTPADRMWDLQPNTMLRGGNDMRGDAAVSNQPFDPSYYTERKYLSEFSEAQLALIRRRLDPKVVEGLGYQEE